MRRSAGSRTLFSPRQRGGFLPGNAAVAEAYGELTAEAKRRGRRGPDNDTWIAACCVSKRLPLATLNVKDFHYFAEHHGLELITA